jgi:hypothetical protein
VVTRHVLIFKTVFLLTLPVNFILRVISDTLIQNQHFLIVSNVFIRWSHCSFFRLHHILDHVSCPCCMDVHQRTESRRQTGSVGTNHDLTADGSSVIASQPTTRAALLVLPICCIHVTSQGRLATRMLFARHSYAAAAPWRISSWPFVAVNGVFLRIAFTCTGYGGPNDRFFIYMETNLLQNLMFL